MKTIKLYMDQGVVADLHNYVLYSCQFSSCAPIVMYNSGDKVAGLYHWAGGEVNMDKLNILDLMRIVIDPDIIHIFTGLGTWDDRSMSNNIMDVHCDPLAKWFDECCPMATINNTRAKAGSIWVSVNSGNLKLDTHDPIFGHTVIDLKVKSIPHDCDLFGETEVADHWA